MADKTVPQTDRKRTVPDTTGLLLTALAAAEFLGVGSTRFYELRRTRGFPKPIELPSNHLNPDRRYRRADLERWVASLPEAQP